MSYYNTPPQRFLDEIHTVNVTALYEPGLSTRARREAITAARSRLAQVRQRLVRQQDDIRGRHNSGGGRRKTEPTPAEKRDLAPYLLLTDLITQIEEHISQLEQVLEEKRLLPEPFRFGNRIFGSEEGGEWFLGYTEDEELWQHMQRVRQQLDHFMQQRSPQAGKIKALKARAAVLQSDLKRAANKLSKRRRKRSFAIQLLLTLLLAALLAGAGFVLFQQGQMAGLAAVGFALLLLLSIPFGWRRWRRQVATLQATVIEKRQALATLKVELDAALKLFRPLNERCRSLQTEYQALRQGFRR